MSVPFFFPGIVRLIVSPIDDGINLVTTTTSTSFNVAQQITPQKAVAWKIIAYGISSSVATAFSVHSRVHVKGAVFDPGIVRPVVWPLDVPDFVPQSAWNADFRLSVQKKTTWRVIQRRSVKKPAAFNVYNYEFAGRNTSWKVLQRLHKPGVTVGFWVNELVTHTVHPLSEPNFSPTPKVQWNTRQKLKPAVKVRWNVRIPASVQKRTTWDTEGIVVVKQVAVSWVTRQEVSLKPASRWRLASRRPAKKRTTWSVNNPVVVRKATSWRATDHVSKSSAVKWNVSTRRNKPVVSRWNDLSRFRWFKQTQFKVMFRVALKTWKLTPTVQTVMVRPVVWPLDVRYPLVPPAPYRGVVRPVVFPLSYPFYAGLQASPGITWRLGINPAGRVSSVKAVTFNIRVPVVSRKSSAWTTVGRRNFRVSSKFNTYNLVRAGTIIEWNTGVGVSGFIRQTSQQRTDFAF